MVGLESVLALRGIGAEGNLGAYMNVCSYIIDYGVNLVIYRVFGCLV